MPPALCLLAPCHQDKLSHLKRQLTQLSELTHPDWSRRIKRLDQAYKERMRINAVVKELELDMVEHDYLTEKKNAAREFEEKKVLSLPSAPCSMLHAP